MSTLDVARTPRSSSPLRKVNVSSPACGRKKGAGEIMFGSKKLFVRKLGPPDIALGDHGYLAKSGGRLIFLTMYFKYNKWVGIDRCSFLLS